MASTIQEVRQTIFNANVARKEIIAKIGTLTEDEKANIPDDVLNLLDNSRFHIEQLVNILDRIEI